MTRPGSRQSAPITASARPATSPLARWWASASGIDSRSLGLFRIGIAAVVLCDLASRAADLRAHYTDWGILPRWAVVTWLGPGAWLSPFLWRDGAWWAAGLMLATAAAATGLLVGWRSRTMAVLCFVLVAGLHARNPAVDHGGDNMLRVLLFWMPLLPLPGAWAIGGPRSVAARMLRGPGVFAIRLQLCIVYWVTGLLKCNAVWLVDRDGILAALSFDQMATSWGRVLLHWPRLMRALAPGTIALELGGPLLVWSPWANGPLRFVVVLAFVCFHLVGIAPAFVLGTFPWVCAVAWALFVPEWLWERIGAGAPASEAGATRSPASWRGAVGAGVLGAVLLYLTVLAAGSIRPDWALPAKFELPASIVGIRQQWNMFLRPPRDDGWFVMAGRLANGSVRDVWRDAPVNARKPDSVAQSYGNSRWIKYLVQLNDRSYVHHRRLFGNYLCRRWNEHRRGGERLVGVRLYFLLELTLADGKEAPPQPVLLWQQACP